MSIKRTALAGTAALISFPVVCGSFASPAGASRSCTPEGFARFDGRHNANVANLGGIMGNITVQYGAFCSSAVGLSDSWSAWVMLTGSADTNRHDYAQSGFVAQRYPGKNDSFPYDFAQVNREDGSHEETIFTQAYRYPGNTPKYWSQIGAYTTLEMNQGVYFLLRSSFPAYGNWPGPVGYQLEGETHNLGSDMPGNPGSHTVFWSVQQRLAAGWVAGPPAGSIDNDNPNHWGNASGGLEIWTSSP